MPDTPRVDDLAARIARQEARRATVRVAGEVMSDAINEAVVDGLAEVLAKRLPGDGPWLVYPGGSWVRVDTDSIVGEHDRYRQHSERLNAVLYALAEARDPARIVAGRIVDDPDAVLEAAVNALIAVRGERAAIISHALRQCQLFDGPGEPVADYDEAAAIVAALGFPLEGHVNGGELDDDGPRFTCKNCGQAIVASADDPDADGRYSYRHVETGAWLCWAGVRPAEAEGPGASPA